MGGRNSKKVELKSIECYDPATNAWTLLDGEGGTIKKRWGAASVELGMDFLRVDSRLRDEIVTIWKTKSF